MKEQVGHRALINQLKQELPLWGEKLPQLPLLAHKVLKQASEGNLQVQMDDRDIEQIRREIRNANAQRNKSIAGSGILLSSAIVYATGTLPVAWPIAGAIAGLWLLSLGLST